MIVCTTDSRTMNRNFEVKNKNFNIGYIFVKGNEI